MRPCLRTQTNKKKKRTKNRTKILPQNLIFFFLNSFSANPGILADIKGGDEGEGGSSLRSGDVRDGQKITSKPNYALLLSEKK